LILKQKLHEMRDFLVYDGLLTSSNTERTTHFFVSLPSIVSHFGIITYASVSCKKSYFKSQFIAPLNLSKEIITLLSTAVTF
jgi:hypothetical protein